MKQKSYYEDSLLNKIVKICIFLVMIGIPLLIYSQERNPFEPFLPQERREERVQPESVPVSFTPSFELSFAVQGILWGTDNPQAIIDSKVYGVGDRIKGSDAIIQRIEDGIIFIYFQGRIYEYRT